MQEKYLELKTISRKIFGIFGKISAKTLEAKNWQKKTLKAVKTGREKFQMREKKSIPNQFSGIFRTS